MVGTAIRMAVAVAVVGGGHREFRRCMDSRACVLVEWSGCRDFLVRRGILPGHRLRDPNRIVQRSHRIHSQRFRADRQSKPFAKLAENLSFLDAVNAEICFQIRFEVHNLGCITRELNHQVSGECPQLRV